MKNRYSATCYKCGAIVTANSGETNLSPTGKWLTNHTYDCERLKRDQNYHYDAFEEYGNYTLHWSGCETSEDVNPNEGSK
jgi:hypothetical protein